MEAHVDKDEGHLCHFTCISVIYVWDLNVANSFLFVTVNVWHDLVLVRIFRDVQLLMIIVHVAFFSSPHVVFIKFWGPLLESW